MSLASAILNHSPYLGIFILLFLGEIGLPFPEDATLILSGFLVSQGVTRPVPTLLTAYCGLLITDFSLYWVGKKYGRQVVEHKRFQKILSSKRLLKLEKKFRKWDVWVVFVGRHLFGIRAQVFLAAGVMKMGAIKFLLADAVSAIFSIALMVGIGYLGGNSIEALKRNVTRIEHVAGVILMLLVAAWIIFRRSRTYRRLKDKF